MDYTYNIEDGQFGKEIDHDKLLGEPGDIINLDDDFGDTVEAYILFIDGNYIQCVGNVERSFPKNIQEHNQMVDFFRIEEEREYSFTYFNSHNEIAENLIVITANSKNKAIEIFKSDNPDFEIYKVD